VVIDASVLLDFPHNVCILLMFVFDLPRYPLPKVPGLFRASARGGVGLDCACHFTRGDGVSGEEGIQIHMTEHDFAPCFYVANSPCCAVAVEASKAH